MKKLFAMFLALTMTFQLITPAWADAAVEEPEEVTEASEVVEEVEPEEDVPVEETTEVTEEELSEETTEATEEETEPTLEELPEEEVAPQYGEGVLDSGSCGENLTYVLDSNYNLVITGSGDMYSDDSNPGWFYYRDKIKTVTLPDGLTSIGYEAFYWCSGLTSVTIPESVESIGELAFYGCTNLTSITFEHRGYDPLTIGRVAFGPYDLLGGPTDITVYVPSVKTMNPGIRDYDWTNEGNYRNLKIAFVGPAQFQ